MDLGDLPRQNEPPLEGTDVAEQPAVVTDANFSIAESTTPPDSSQETRGGPDPQPASSLLMAALSADLSSLKELVDNRLAYDAGKEELIRTLAREISVYRDDWLAKQQRPLLLDLVMLYDNVEGIRAGLLGPPAIPAEIVEEKLNFIRDELLELLERNGVTRYEQPLGRLDPRRHRVIKVEPTTVAEEHDVVVSVKRHGFVQSERVLRPEEVVIKKLTRIEEV